MRLWLVSTHLLPDRTKFFLKDSQGQKLLLVDNRNKSAFFGKRRECIHMDLSCEGHLLLKQRKVRMLAHVLV